MFRKGLLSVLLILMLVFAINVVFPVSDFFAGLSLINDVHELINDKYVEGGELGEETLSYDAVRGMLTGLDRHTSFFTPEESRRFIADIEGSFGGLGIRIDKQGEFVVVVSPIEGTPAYRLGIKSGDRIVSVDGTATAGMSMDNVIELLRGDVGTDVEVGMMREGVPETLLFNITREKIELPSISASFMLDDKTGYVRFAHFQENSLEEMTKVLDELSEMGMRSLILDLRYNPGGVLHIAGKILDLFVREGNVLVTTKGREGKLLEEYTSTDYTPYGDLELAVIVDGGSASASEIVAGAVKDLKRGLLVGEKTFGKGSVQRIFTLKDGSALKLTIAHYYTPAGICVDGSGIEPDYPVKSAYYPDQMVDLIRNRKFAGFAASMSGKFAYKNGMIKPDPFPVFVEYLNNNGFDFKESFLKDKLTSEMIIREIPDWKERILNRLKPEIVKRLDYQLIMIKSGEEEARKYWIKDDPMILRSLSLLKGGNR